MVRHGWVRLKLPTKTNEAFQGLTAYDFFPLGRTVSNSSYSLLKIKNDNKNHDSWLLLASKHHHSGHVSKDMFFYSVVFRWFKDVPQKQPFKLIMVFYVVNESGIRWGQPNKKQKGISYIIPGVWNRFCRSGIQVNMLLFLLHFYTPKWIVSKRWNSNFLRCQLFNIFDGWEQEQAASAVEDMMARCLWIFRDD